MCIWHSLKSNAGNSKCITFFGKLSTSEGVNPGPKMSKPSTCKI